MLLKCTVLFQIEDGVYRFDVQRKFQDKPDTVQVEVAIEALLYKIRDAKVDPYGFGLHYLGQHFGNEKDWAYWQSVYPEVNFEVETHVKIESTGLVH